MGRNLIIACDGTNNQFGTENTNVVRLIQCLDRSVDRQIIYYDPGVGTLPEPGWVSWAGKGLSKVAGLAFGAGLKWKVSQAYRFLMDYWVPGDKVFLYGFSRGAYTARVLAGFLHMFGLLPAGDQCLLPYGLRLYAAARKRLRPRNSSHKEFWDLCDGFRETFAREVPGAENRRFPIHFLGLWDTVSSVGWVWDPARFPFTARNPSVSIVRHAISIDERRWFFRQNQFDRIAGQDLEERWFPGVHCDVGGGYPLGEGGLWQGAFQWILETSKQADLYVDATREAKVWALSRRVPAPWNEPQHESLTWKWWPAEFVPKLRYVRKLSMSLPMMGLFRRRFIDDEAVPHEVTLKRIAEKPNYRPPNIPPSWYQMADPHLVSATARNPARPVRPTPPDR